MTTMIKILSGLLITLGIIAFIFTYGCNEPHTKSEKHSTDKADKNLNVSAPSATASIYGDAKTITAQQASDFKNYWKDRKRAELSRAFLVKESDSTDIIRLQSYYISGEALKDMIDSAGGDTHDLVIRVHPAITLPNQRVRINEQVAFNPLIQVIRDTAQIDNLDNTYQLGYDLRKQILSELDSYIAEAPIDPIVAKKLIEEWDNLDLDDIIQTVEIYNLENRRPTDTLRLQYYTFEASEFRAVRARINNRYDQFDIRFHLGHNDSYDPLNEHFELKMVMHVSEKSSTGLNADPLFEFSSPCPHKCGGNSL
jgi:hypothetical protein